MLQLLIKNAWLLTMINAAPLEKRDLGPFTPFPFVEDCKAMKTAWLSLGGSPDTFPPEDSFICCGHNGVNCDEDGYINEIIWNSKSFTGPIPAVLGNLKKLQKLYSFKSLISREMSNCQLTGTIPLNLLVNLTSLKEL